MVKGGLFARSILLGAFGKARQCRPRLLTWSLIENSFKGVVDGSRPAAMELDVGGDGVETLMIVAGFCQQKPWT
jgi:hypothetical protein